MRCLLLLAPVALLAVACTAAEDPGAVDSANSDVVASQLQGFDCTTETKIDGEIQHMTFSVQDIGKKSKMNVLDPNGQENGDYMPIKVVPEEGRVSSLNENLEWYIADDRVTIHGDSDGFYLLDLVLFKDSGYQKGYLRISHAEESDNAYSLVTCKVTPMTATPAPTH
jgi:hypothetical protein